MENSISISLSPIQILLSMAFQIWMIVFPIILIRKLNYLTNLILAKDYEEDKKNPEPD